MLIYRLVAEVYRNIFTPYFGRLILILSLGIVTTGLTACGGEADAPNEEEPTTQEPPIEEPPVEEPPVEEPPTTEQPELPDSHPELYETGLFLKEHVLDVSVEMSTADWNAMRAEGPTVSGCHAADYNDYLATVTIDGEAHDEVTISKKGGLGSQSSTRPSIKLNYGKGDTYEDRTFQGDKRLTLNNNRQDTTNLKQCLAYYLYNAAGIHSPRCNFANVTLRGTNQGIYTHVEAIKKPFLEWRFDDKSGNLYETQRDGEFTQLRAPLFQKKTNEDEADYSDVQAVADALDLEGDAMYSAVGELINIKAFARFAIMEAMVGQIDGYTSNQNNTYLYRNPADNLFYFIPWGADITFTRRHLREAGAQVPASIFLGSVLIQKLWQIPEFQTLYDAQVRDILDNVWNETVIIDEIERIADIVNTSNSNVNAIVQFINEKRALVEAELNGSASREWRWDLMADDYCINN